MAWSWRKKNGGGDDRAWSREQPDSKRRKVAEVPHVEQTEKHDVNDDEWGDDDYTQDQLEELALLDSQVTLQPQAPVAAERAEQSNVSFIAPVGAARRSTSPSSNSSVLPRSLSSSRSTNDTCGSLSSHLSSNGKLDSSVELVHTLQTRLDEEKRKGQEEKNFYDGQVRSLRDRLHKQEGELEKLRALRDESYEQQKQALNEDIRKLKSQLGNVATEACFKDKECQNLQEKNAVLQQKLKKIEQQQSTSGMLDVRLQLSPKPASPRKVVVEPSPPSKQKQQEARDSRKTNFPTTQTFMHQTSPTSHVSGKSVSSASCQTPGTAHGRMSAHCRLQLHTGSEQAFGEMAGPQVVRHLLQLTDYEAPSEVKDEKVLWDPGVASLLQDMSTSLKIASLTYSREKDSHFLIPLRPKKQTQGLRSSSVDTSDATVQIVTRQNLQLAVEGITHLLQDTTSNQGKGGLDSEISRISDTSINMNIPSCTETVGGNPRTVEPIRELAPAESSSHADSAQTSNSLGVTNRTEISHNSGAVLILPLLTNYIQHYVDLIHSSSGRVGGTLGIGGAERTTSSQSLDSSTDTNFDSVSSHLGQLLQEGCIYASNIEGCVLTALRCLVILICLCPAVRRTIIMCTHPGVTPPFSTVRMGSCRSSSTSIVETETEQSKKTPSSADADDEGSTGSSEIRIIKTGSNRSNQSVDSDSSLLDSRARSSLLHLVLRLAGQDLQDGQSNPEVVKLALWILTCLCQRSTQEELPKLEPIITREILSKCFQQTKHASVLIYTVRLLLSLAKSEQLLTKLCTKSDRCPLYLMHRACSLKAEGMFHLQRECEDDDDDMYTYFLDDPFVRTTLRGISVGRIGTRRKEYVSMHYVSCECEDDDDDMYTYFLDDPFVRTTLRGISVGRIGTRRKEYVSMHYVSCECEDDDDDMYTYFLDDPFVRTTLRGISVGRIGTRRKEYVSMHYVSCEYVISLSSIISEHRAGLHFLVSNACPCTNELVAAVILTLYNLLSTYTTASCSHQAEILHTLCQGISLVLSLVQSDGLFAQHCGSVHQQYVRLITGLSSILKSDAQTWEQYLPVIDELNEFEPDSSDTSHESGNEDKMDQS